MMLLGFILLGLVASGLATPKCHCSDEDRHTVQNEWHHFYGEGTTRVPIGIALFNKYVKVLEGPCIFILTIIEFVLMQIKYLVISVITFSELSYSIIL